MARACNAAAEHLNEAKRRRVGACVEQGLEDGELLGGEVERASVAGSGVCKRVKLDSGCPERAMACGGFAACERAGANDQLGE
jgi:hypothetical protein